jgi:rhodanese-related sulfurtransferase
MNSITKLSPQAVAGSENTVLLDVRTALERREVHIADSRHIPLEKLKPEDLSKELAGQRVVLVCRSGGRAEQAAGRLAAAGCTDLYVLDGGLQAWETAGLPVIRGQGVMAVDRQVRIAIGILVLAGWALGQWVHPAFFGICAFMGAGLIFSGLANFCGLALILARAPWNRADPRRVNQTSQRLPTCS